MKKLLTSLLALLTCFTCATAVACGESGNNSGNNSSNTGSSNTGESSNTASPDEEDELKDAVDYLEALYKDENVETRADYEVLPAIMGYPITWTVDVATGVTITTTDSGKVIVDVDELLDENLTYVLTATVADGDRTLTVSFTRVVLAAPSLIPVAITEAPVEGVAYKYHVYQSTLAQDLYFAGDTAATYYYKTTTNVEEAVDIFAEYVDGSTTDFYLYFVKDDVNQYLGVKVSDDGAHDNIIYGPTKVSTFVWNEDLGTVTTHLDATKNNGGPNDFYFGNYGTKDTISCSYLSYAGGEGNNVGHLVTIVDKNSITPEVKVEESKEGLNLSKTDFVGATEVDLPVARHADVVVAWACESDLVSIAAGKLVITAPEAETTVVLTATLTCGEVSDTKEFTLTLKPASNLPAAGSTLTIPEANELGVALGGEYTEGKYYVSGVVSSIKNTQYGNLYIKDADGNEFYVYGVYSADGQTRYDAMTNAPQVGDTITVYGVIGSYSGSPQMKNGWMTAYTAGENGGNQGGGEGSETPVDPPAVEIPEGALTASVSMADYAAANSWANGTRYGEVVISEGFTVTATGTPVGDYDLNTGKYYTSGTTWRIYQTENATLTITANEGLTIVAVKVSYAVKNTGCLTLNGENIDTDTLVAVNATTISFGVGNTSTATNGQAQITAIEVIYTGSASGETPAPHEHAFVEGKCECGAEDPNYVPEGGETPAPEAITTIAGALAGNEGDKATFSGTVSSIYQAWNSQYSNMSFYVTDGTDTILVFRAGTLVGIGDEVSVDGTVTIYNSSKQIAAGATVTITTAHVCSTFTEADCLNAAKCTVCDKVNGEALGHTDADSNGVCDVCETNLSASTTTASKTIAELITSEGWTSTTTKQQFNLDENVTVKVNGGNNSGKAYEGTHIRIYATDSPAGTLTITVAEGYELVSVKVTTQTGTYAFLCVDGTNVDISNVQTSVSGSSVVLNSVKNGSDGKQVRVLAIEVEYAPIA